MVVRLGGVVTFLQIKKKMLYRNTKVIYSKCYFMGFLNLKHKITLKVQIYINLQNHPTFHSEERLVNTLLVLLVYMLTHWAPPARVPGPVGERDPCAGGRQPDRPAPTQIPWQESPISSAILL